MKEGEPRDHNFRHHKRITLNYNGIAGDIIDLHDPTADGFMRVSDMRRDVVIVKGEHDRGVDYSELGEVRIARFISIPRFGAGREDPTLSTRKEDDVWVVAIDDQVIKENVHEEDFEKGSFDALFIDRFRDKVNKGLRRCLRQEKLLNSGEYNVAFYYNYFFLFVAGSQLISSAVALDSGRTDLINIISPIVLTYVNDQIHPNVVIKTVAVLREYILSPFFTPDDEPFVRNWRDIYMPTVPIDRLIRGLYYLHQHGDELLMHDHG